MSDYEIQRAEQYEDSRDATPQARPSVQDVERVLAEVLEAHEARWTTHGWERLYQVIHCADSRCGWRLRQKVSMSNDECYEAHRAHVAAEQAAALRALPAGDEAEGLTARVDAHEAATCPCGHEALDHAWHGCEECTCNRSGIHAALAGLTTPTAPTEETDR